jgi:hypothetical protein
VKCVGRWDLKFTLPPVPKRGTYETRYRILTNRSRGVAQFYFGDKPGSMPAAGIPVNLSLGGDDPITGWIADTGTDDDTDSEADKQMRNNGFMKGSAIYACPVGGAQYARNRETNLRRIIVREYMHPEAKVYGVLFDLEGNTASSCQFFITDSTHHFFRASVYCNCPPNADSLAPVYEYLRKDVVKMVETFEWKRN